MRASYCEATTVAVSSSVMTAGPSTRWPGARESRRQIRNGSAEREAGSKIGRSSGADSGLSSGAGDTGREVGVRLGPHGRAPRDHLGVRDGPDVPAERTPVRPVEQALQDVPAAAVEPVRRDVDDDLVALSLVAHVGLTAYFEPGRVSRAEPDVARRFVLHLFVEPIDGAGIEVVRALVQGPDHLVGDRRPQEADRRSDPGVSRDHDAPDPQLVGELAGVQRRRAAEGDQRPIVRVLAALDGVDPGRARHVLAHHLGHAEGRRVERERHGVADPAPKGVLGPGPVQRHLAAREVLRGDSSHHHVGVGDGRLAPAEAIARRSRLRPGAFRPDREPAQLVDPGDGAAARADLHHVDDRDAQRNAAVLAEAIDARDLESSAGLGRAAVDQADLRGGAAHVERHRLVQAVRPCDRAGEDGAASRPRFHQPDREALRGLHRGQPSAREHQQERAAKPALAQRGVEAVEVALHEGPHVGVGAGGGEAFELAELGRYVRGDRDRPRRPAPREVVAGEVLVGRIGVAVEEADGQRLGAGGIQGRKQGVELRFVEGDQNFATAVQPFRDREPPPPGNQGPGLDDVDLVLLGPSLRAHLDGVTKPLGGDQRRRRPLAFEDRVGRQRRSVNDHSDVAGAEPRTDEPLLQRLHAGGGRVVGGGQDLGGEPPATEFERDIGEGPADVDPDPRSGASLTHERSVLLGELAVERSQWPSAKISPIPGCGRGSVGIGCVERGQGARRTGKYACAP